jgi:hypothetical protein
LIFDIISLYVKREGGNYYGDTRILVIAAMSVKTSSRKAVLYGYGKTSAAS